MTRFALCSGSRVGRGSFAGRQAAPRGERGADGLQTGTQKQLADGCQTRPKDPPKDPAGAIPCCPPQDWLRQHEPALYAGCRYTCIEISPLLAERQRQRVAEEGGHGGCFDGASAPQAPARL